MQSCVVNKWLLVMMVTVYENEIINDVDDVISDVETVHLKDILWYK